MNTVGQLTDHYARAHVRDQGSRPPLTLPEIWVDQPMWRLDWAAWRVQLVDTPTDLPTPHGRYLRVEHVAGDRHDVMAAVDGWRAERWTGAYVSPPMGVRQHEPTDPQMAAAFAAADARYGR